MQPHEIDELVSMTKGYSGADLKNLAVEAAMIPLRSILDIASVDINNIRATDLSDFREALKSSKPSVNTSQLQHFLDWNDKYGSFPISKEDLADWLIIKSNVYVLQH